MLTQRSRYALRAMIFLAQAPAGSPPIPMGRIASEANVPRKFLELILAELREAGLLHSHRGKHGGYCLARPVHLISLGDVIRTIEGPLYVAGTTVRDGVSRIDIDPDPAAGPLVIHGTVTGPEGKPVAGAVVECWHANSNGFYSHFAPTGAQSPFNLRGAVRTGADGKYEFRTLMPVGYGCPPQGATQQLLNGLARHGNRPAHVHFFVTSNGHRKLTTQFNIEGDPLIWDDFAYATREELIPHVVEKTGGAALGLKGDTYKDIEFNVVLTPLVQGKDNQRVNRLRASAEA